MHTDGGMTIKLTFEIYTARNGTYIQTEGGKKNGLRKQVLDSPPVNQDGKVYQSTIGRKTPVRKNFGGRGPPGGDNGRGTEYRFGSKIRMGNDYQKSRGQSNSFLMNQGDLYNGLGRSVGGLVKGPAQKLILQPKGGLEGEGRHEPRPKKRAYQGN